MEREVIIQGPKGRISGIICGNSKKSGLIVLLVHGFGSNKNNKMNMYAKTSFDNLGIPTLRIDMYNHGNSSGYFEDMTVSDCIISVNSAINFLVEKGYKNICLFGSSMGGLICTISASQYSEFVKTLILKSPTSVNQGDVIANYYRINLESWKRTGFFEWTNKLGLKSKLKFKFYPDAQKYNLHVISQKIKIPVLIVHGTNDDFIPINDSLSLNDSLESSTIKEIKNGGHFYTIEEMKILMKFVIKFLQEKDSI